MVQNAPAEMPVSSANLDTFICLSAKIKLSDFWHVFRSHFHRTPSVRVIFNRLSSKFKLFSPKFHFVVRRGRLPTNYHHAFKYLLWLLTFFSKKFYNWSLLQIEQFLRNLTHRFTWHAVTLEESHWTEAAYVNLKTWPNMHRLVSISSLPSFLLR